MVFSGHPILGGLMWYSLRVGSGMLLLGPGLFLMYCDLSFWHAVVSWYIVPCLKSLALPSTQHFSEHVPTWFKPDLYKVFEINKYSVQFTYEKFIWQPNRRKNALTKLLASKFLLLIISMTIKIFWNEKSSCWNERVHPNPCLTLSCQYFVDYF